MQLQKYIESYFESNHLKCPELISFTSGESLLADKEEKDIVFLDIEMPGMNGIYVGNELKKENKNVIIFVVTSYSEYLDDAMRFHVFRYLSKPLDKQRFFRNMKDALAYYNSITTKIPVETKQGVYSFPSSQIIAIEAQGRKVIVHTTRQDFDSIHNMNYWLEHLPKNSFFQTHRSFIVINTVFLYALFKLRLLLALFHSAILTAIMGISELAVFGIMSRFFPHFLLEAGVGLIFYTVFSKIFFFAIIYLLIHLFKGKKANQEQYNHSELLLMLIPVSSVFIMFTFLAIGETSSFAAPVDFMVTICAVFLLMVNLLVFGINQYNQKKSQEFTDMQLLLQKESDSVEYYEMMLSQNENQSILIHDIKKHLQSIKLLNEKNDSEKIDAYIQQLMESSDLKETIKVCDNEMLNAILCPYQRQCNDKHIAFHTDIRSGTVQNIYQHDLTSLFCNLLDNAVEAAEKIPDSFIELTVQKKENSPFIVIIVINSCRSAPQYDASHLPVSTKKDSSKHGYGMKNIKKVIRKYNGDLQMYYDNVSATFHTIVTLRA